MILYEWVDEHLNSTAILFASASGEVQSEFSYFNDDKVVMVKRYYEAVESEWRVLLYEEAKFR